MSDPFTKRGLQRTPPLVDPASQADDDRSQQSEEHPPYGAGVNTGRRGKSKQPGNDSSIEVLTLEGSMPTRPLSVHEERAPTMDDFRELQNENARLRDELLQRSLSTAGSSQPLKQRPQHHADSQQNRGVRTPDVPVASIERASPTTGKKKNKKNPRSRSQSSRRSLPSHDSRPPSNPVAPPDDPPSPRGPHFRSPTTAVERPYIPKPTNLSSKLKDGVEPKASLWQLLVTERLELYENSLTSEAQRRSYVVDQTEGEAQEHVYSLYTQVPRLTGQQLIDELAAIYRNPAEVDHARTEYEHWTMPNGAQRGNFVVWYRRFRLLATQAEIIDGRTLFRDLERKISDFLRRAIGLHIKDCANVQDLANKLTEIDELEVTIRERNRYRQTKETPVKKVNTNTHTQSAPRNNFRAHDGANPSTQSRTNFPPRNVPTGYTGSFRPSPTPPPNSNFNRNSSTPAPGANRGATPRSVSFADVIEIQEGGEGEDFYDAEDGAEDDLNSEVQAEAVDAAQHAEDQRLNTDA